jgi:carbonic anhydrase
MGEDNMDTLLERNQAFAATSLREQGPAIPFIPNRQVYVITCIDPRVDPAGILGLEFGDAIVERNVGGRITAAVIQDVAWISYLHEVKTPDADWFEVAIIHHTDCGSGFISDPELRHGFAQRGFDEAELAALPVLHPAETVKVDVERLSAETAISPQVKISGYAYDVATGVVTTVVPARVRVAG